MPGSTCQWHHWQSLATCTEPTFNAPLSAVTSVVLCWRLTCTRLMPSTGAAPLRDVPDPSTALTMRARCAGRPDRDCAVGHRAGARRRRAGQDAARLPDLRRRTARQRPPVALLDPPVLLLSYSSLRRSSCCNNGVCGLKFRRYVAQCCGCQCANEDALIDALPQGKPAETCKSLTIPAGAPVGTTWSA